MRSVSFLLLLILVLSFVSCSHVDDGGFSLRRENDSLYFLQLDTDAGTDSWELPYPVYRFDTGDVNSDSVVEALVGVEKTTRFDSCMHKRLFIFKNFDGKVRPLWLGSRLGQPIVDFRVVTVDDEVRIRSIEEERNGKFLVAEYRWDSFGLKFIRYTCRDFEFETAKDFFNC